MKNNDLGNDRIGSLLVRLALPAITAQLINALYNIVDRIYIGHMPGKRRYCVNWCWGNFPNPDVDIRFFRFHRHGWRSACCD